MSRTKYMTTLWMSVVLVYALVVLTVTFVPTTMMDDSDFANKKLTELVLPIVRLEGHMEAPDGTGYSWRGSGVIIYSRINENNGGFDSYVLTCNHCVEIPQIDPESEPYNPTITGMTYGVDYIEIFNSTMQSSRKVPGVIVAHSNNNVFYTDTNGDMRISYDGEMVGDFELPSGEDLALVRLLTNERLQAVKIMNPEDIDNLQLFFKARVVGCSLGMKPYHTFGEITRLEGDYMSVNAPFVPGNSGGACYLDSTHEFIGITNAGFRSAPHMGLIRPLKHIYNWMFQNGYNWIYDESVSNQDRFNKIRSDKSNYDLQSFNTIKEFKEEICCLKQRINVMSNIIKNLNTTVENLNNEIENLNNIKDMMCQIIQDFFRSSTKVKTEL